MMSNLYKFTSSKSFAALTSSISKIVGNIPSTAACIYFGIADALRDINVEYKALEHTMSSNLGENNKNILNFIVAKLNNTGNNDSNSGNIAINKNENNTNANSQNNTDNTNPSI